MQCCYSPLLECQLVDKEEQDTGITYDFNATVQGGNGLEFEQQDGASVVKSVTHLSQAFHQGVQVGMRLIKVGGVRCTSHTDAAYVTASTQGIGKYTLTLLPVEEEWFECLVDRDGLPLPVDKREGITFRFLSWLCHFFLVLLVFWTVKKAWFINEFHPLEFGKDAYLNLFNCDLVFRPYTDLNWWRPDYIEHMRNMWDAADQKKSMLHLRYPKLWNVANFSADVSENGTYVTMSVSKRRSFLACRATFYLREDENVALHFKNMLINMASSGENVLDATFATPLKAHILDLHAYQAQVRAHNSLVVKDARLNVTDGVVEIRVNESATPEKLHVETKKAPIAIVALNVDMHTDLSEGAANMSFIWASGSITGFHHHSPDKCQNTKLLTAGVPSEKTLVIKIVTPKLYGPGVYLLANQTNRTECLTGNMTQCMGSKPRWGLGQVKPSINPAGEARLKKIREWVHEDSKAPYVVYIHIVNPNLPHGTWRFMSSRVYLAFSTELFVMFSAGMLRPRQQKITLHIDGLWSWPPGYPKVWSDELMREHCYRILYDFFDHTSTSVSLFSPSTSHDGTRRPELIYEKGNNDRVHTHPIEFEENVMFILAAGINLGVGMILSAVLVYLGYTYGLPILLRKISDANCTLVATHRLTNQVGQATSSWRVLAWVSNCDLAGTPSHGIQFRWKTRERAKHFARYSLMAKGKKYYFDYQTGTTKAHVTTFETRLSKTQIKTVRGNAGQVEFFMSTQHPGTREALEAEPFHDPLEYGRRYRFTYRGIDKMGNILETSQASNVLEMTPPAPLTELPFMLCQFFFQAPVDTLKEFVADQMRSANESTMVFTIRDVLARYTGSVRDPTLEKDWRVFFYFGDNVDQARESTSRGDALSYACSANQARATVNETGSEKQGQLNDAIVAKYRTVTHEDGPNEFKVARPTILSSAIQIKNLNVAVCLGSDETVGVACVPVRSLFACWDKEPLPPKVNSPAETVTEGNSARDIKYKVRLAESEGFSAEAGVDVKFNVGFGYFGKIDKQDEEQLAKRGQGLGLFFDLDIHCYTYFNGFNRLLTWNADRFDTSVNDYLTFHLVFVDIPYDIPATEFFNVKCRGKAKHPRKSLSDASYTWIPSQMETLKREKPKLAKYITDIDSNAKGGHVVKSKGIASTTGAFAWTVDLDNEIFDYLDDDSVRCRIDVMAGRGTLKEQKMLKLKDRDAACPAIYIQRCLLLGDFEIAYAAFCRFNRVPMQQVDPSRLDELGIRLLKQQLAIVKGVREFFPFETEDKQEYDYAMMSEGAVVYAKDLAYKLQPRNPEPGKSEEDRTYRPRLPTEVVRVPVIDNFALKPLARWKQRYLLSRGVDYTPFLITKLLAPIYSLLPEKSNRFPFLLKLITRAVGLLDVCLMRIGWSVNVLGIFILQTTLFQFSTLFIAIGLVFTCWAQVLCHPGYWVHDVFSENQISDLAFSQSPFFVAELPDQVVMVLKIICVESLVFHFLVFWGNFGAHCASVAWVLNIERFAKFWWGKSLFLSTCIIAVVTLWFILGALIDPEAMMPVAVAVLSLIGTAKSLWKEFLGLQERVLDVVNDQVDMILGVVLDVFFDITGITDADIKEFTPDEMANAHKIRTAIDARFATSSGGQFAFDRDKKAKKEERVSAQMGGFSGSLANLDRLKRAHRYFMNLVDVEELVKLMGNPELLACIKKGGADEIQKIFNLTWASTMVPYFGPSAKSFADQNVLMEYGADLIENKNIQVTLWQHTQNKKMEIAGLYCDMMEDLYDRDDVIDKIAAFYDTELALMLQNEINLLVSASSARSQVMKMSRDIMGEAEKKVLEAAKSGTRFVLQGETKGKDKSFLDFLVEIGVVPKPVEDVVDREHGNMFRNVFAPYKLLAEVMVHRDRICNTSQVTAVQALDIVKGLLRGKITWSQFNFMLVVLGVNDVQEIVDDNVKDTICCYGGKNKPYNGIYVRNKKDVPKEKMKDLTGRHQIEYIPRVYSWTRIRDPEDGDHTPHKPAETYLKCRMEVVNGKKMMFWEHYVDGIKRFQTGRTKDPNVPSGSGAGAEGWFTVKTDEKYPQGQGYQHFFDEAQCAKECKETTLYKRGERDKLSARARKLFFECSGRTGLMDVSTAADTILTLTGKKIWKTAGCALLKKLTIGGQYGNENYHNRDRAFVNLNMKEVDGQWVSPVDHINRDKETRNPLLRARSGWYPEGWWCSKHQVFDWEYKESIRELSLRECWDMLCNKEDRLGMEDDRKKKFGEQAELVQRWMTKASFYNFLDCVRFFPTTDPTLVEKRKVILNDATPFMYDHITIPAGSDASEETTGDDGKIYRIFGGRARWREEIEPEYYPGQKMAPDGVLPKDAKEGEVPYQRIARCGVRKIYHKPEGENVWYRVKGITLEQCEDLLTKCGYNVQSKAFRNQWRRFISLPYCPFNVLYSGVLEPPQEKAKDFIHHKQQYRYTQKDDDEDGDMEMSLFQFAGTKMMTLDKFRYVLRQLRFSLPPDIEISIFNKCDNPPPSTPFGVLKNFYNNSVLSVKMLGSDFKAILESTKQEIAHAKIYEELRKMCEDSKAELEVEQTEKVRLLISNGKKIIGKEKGYYKVKEQLTELETVAMNTQSNPDKIAALKRVIEIIQTDLRSPRYIVKDGRDDFSSEQFVSQAVQLILHEDKALNLKINDKDQSLILPGPNKIRLYIADKISFESASKEATANTYKTIKELPSFSFPQSGQEDGTNPDTPNESIEKLWAKVEQELNKGADHSAADNCIVTLSMRCLEGYIGDWRGAVVSITDLKDAFCEYVKRGLVFEACQQICKDRLGLTYSSETLRRAFDAVDVDKNGYLEPHEFYLMLLKLFKMGMTFEHMHALMTRLGLKIEKAALLRTFQMMDVDQDGSLGTTEFITGIETLLSTVIPTTVLEKMHLTPTHIIVGITVALLILLLMFVFIFLSMSAFTGPAATSAGIQSVLMAGAAFVVKGEYNAPDLEKLRSSIKEHINAVMGIDKKQAAQAGKDLKKNK